MTQKVRLSTFSIMLSGIVMVILLCALYFSDSPVGISIIGAIIIVWCALSMYYMPLSISVSNVELRVNCTIRTKRISLKEISSIERLQATILGRRVFGSDGWFGYWGWYRDKTLGKYFAYYGNENDCFVLRLNNGKQYVLGCDNPDTIVNYIKSRYPIETA